MDDLARAFAMERRFFDRLSTERHPITNGTAYLDAEYRDRFVSNFLCAHTDLKGAIPQLLISEADEVLGERGYPHRRVLVQSDDVGLRMAAAFEHSGYRTERLLMIALHRSPDRGPHLPVVEVPFAEARPLISEVYRREGRVAPDVTERFTDQHGKYERVLGTRFFVVSIEGELAGVAELWTDGADALVEHVDTLVEFRGRGVARSVVLRAASEARVAGAERVFIAADDDDWPKKLYARLGFDPLGRSWGFMRWPDGAQPRA
jgi:GNAT superfamily N-acetyltransferase